MVDIKKRRPSGRPREFDEQAALAVAQGLFHDRGYDGVGVAELARAMGVSPPSLYAAFGSKAQLFEQALARYTQRGTDFVAAALGETDPARMARSLLLGSVEAYTAPGGCAGCMAIENARDIGDAKACSAARAGLDNTRAALVARIAAVAPDRAEPLADHLIVTLVGLSGAARVGLPADRLRAAAEIAALGFEAGLADARDHPAASGA